MFAQEYVRWHNVCVRCHGILSHNDYKSGVQYLDPSAQYMFRCLDNYISSIKRKIYRFPDLMIQIMTR